jgi:hypothetical protein
MLDLQSCDEEDTDGASALSEDIYVSYSSHDCKSHAAMS